MKTDFCELLFKSAALDLTDTGCRLVLQFHWGFLFLSGSIGLDSNTGWDRDEESCYNLSHFLKMFFKVITMWQKIETAKNPNEVSLCPKGRLTFQKFFQPCLYDKTPESPSTRANTDTVLPHALGTSECTQRAGCSICGFPAPQSGLDPPELCGPARQGLPEHHLGRGRPAPPTAFSGGASVPFTRGVHSTTRYEIPLGEGDKT